MYDVYQECLFQLLNPQALWQCVKAQTHSCFRVTVPDEEILTLHPFTIDIDRLATLETCPNRLIAARRQALCRFRTEECSC